jgi:6-phosphogluconolactonase
VRRISLTLPALNAAREAWFLVSGAGKANILRRILKPESETALLPAQRVQPVNGELVFLVDQAAWPEGR